MRNTWRSFLMAAIAAAWLVMPAHAQETTGTITGIVTDESGGVLPGVTVTVKHVGTGRTLERVTSDTGLYTAPLLPVGAYEITFTLSGFQPLTVTGIALSVNDRLEINGKLNVGWRGRDHRGHRGGSTRPEHARPAEPRRRGAGAGTAAQQPQLRPVGDPRPRRLERPV